METGTQGEGSLALAGSHKTYGSQKAIVEAQELRPDGIVRGILELDSSCLGRRLCSSVVSGH
jgi:hypothetical protein